MKKQTKTVLIVIVIVIIILIAVLSKRSAPNTDQNSNTTAGSTSQMVGTTNEQNVPVQSNAGSAPTMNPAPGTSSGTTTTAPSVKSFTVVGSNYAFVPNTLEVNKGDTVKITFTNSGGMHDFKIDEFKVATERLESGDSTTIQFVADKSGTFQYYCSVGTHRAMGMWGTLTVK